MRELASALLDCLYACGVIVALLYIALSASVLYAGVAGRISTLRDRRRWNQIDSEVDSFRAELDRASADEWRGRAA